MRSHRRWCVIFCASLGSALCLTLPLTHAQYSPYAPFGTNPYSSNPYSQNAYNSNPYSNTPYSNTSPWKPVEASPPPTERAMGQAVMPSDARQAYFQGPGDMGMPQMPPNAMSQAPNAMSQDNGVTPAAFNQFSNPGGAMQATQVQGEPPTQMRDVNSGAINPNTGYGAAPGYRPVSMQEPVYPPATMNPYGNQQANLPPSTMRNSQTGGYAQQPPVVSSTDPRFVMQAPRVGNYPTVPYQPPFRTVAFQLPQQSPQVLPVQPPSALATQPQAVANTTGLPQYQPTVGAQLVNYQAMQPGYCGPTIPSNGVPAFVPGAVAPPTLPPNLAPQMYTPDNSGYRPLFSLGQENYNVQIGRGIIGQPTVYVPGQPVRNFMRYLFP